MVKAPQFSQYFQYLNSGGAESVPSQLGVHILCYCNFADFSDLRSKYSTKIEEKEKMNVRGLSETEEQYIKKHHKHEIKENQCTSFLIEHIKAPVHLVWSLVRRFDQPQKYKPFISRCVSEGNLEIGSLREVDVKSGLPATTSTERLELLDDDQHILRFRIVGGDHRLINYSSSISVHPEVIEGRSWSLVIESFVVDVPEENTKDETCSFVEALIRCNLKSLADASERLALQTDL